MWERFELGVNRVRIRLVAGLERKCPRCSSYPLSREGLLLRRYYCGECHSHFWGVKLLWLRLGWRLE